MISSLLGKALRRLVDIARLAEIYEGGSICNENSPVYPKVLYLHTLLLLFLKYLFLG